MFETLATAGVTQILWPSVPMVQFHDFLSLKSPWPHGIPFRTQLGLFSKMNTTKYTFVGMAMSSKLKARPKLKLSRIQTLILKLRITFRSLKSVTPISILMMKTIEYFTTK